MPRQCETCKAPYITKVFELGRLKKTMEIASCNCDSARQQEREKILKFEREKAVVQKLFIQSQIPEKYRDWTFDGFKLSLATGKAHQVCLNYAKNFKKGCPWLYISGDVGTNKTYLSIAIAIDLVSRFNSCLFVTSENLLDSLRSGYKRGDYYEMMDLLRSCDCLILDDFGSEVLVKKTGEWAKGKLFQLIDFRFSMGLPMVFNSNYKLDQLADRIGKRISRRILEKCEGSCVHIGSMSYEVS